VNKPKPWEPTPPTERYLVRTRHADGSLETISCGIGLEQMKLRAVGHWSQSGEEVFLIEDFGDRKVVFRRERDKRGAWLVRTKVVGGGS
jgi:hypothetical protein